MWQELAKIGVGTGEVKYLRPGHPVAVLYRLFKVLAGAVTLARGIALMAAIREELGVLSAGIRLECRLTRG